MAKPESEERSGGRSAGEAAFSDHKKEIAERNEQAQKAARELRTKREQEQFGIVSRHKVDLDR